MGIRRLDPHRPRGAPRSGAGGAGAGGSTPEKSGSKSGTCQGRRGAKKCSLNQRSGHANYQNKQSPIID